MEPRASTLAHWTVVRHGESTWNEQHLVQGQDDTSRLTERGREQARELGLSLADEHYAAVLSSDLTRTFETASLIVDVIGGDIVTTPLLRERSFGVLEGGPSRGLTPELVGIEGTRVIDENASPPGGESLLDFYLRAGRFVDETTAAYDDARLLIVTHGGTIRALMAHVAREPIAALPWDFVANCSRWEFAVPVFVR
jgi:broad specificity phosphatase PhoE